MTTKPEVITQELRPPHTLLVQKIMDLARKFRGAPSDLYDFAYTTLESEVYAAFAAAQEAQLKDAVRYQWLRNWGVRFEKNIFPSEVINFYANNKLDQLIDGNIRIEAATAAIKGAA